MFSAHAVEANICSQAHCAWPRLALTSFDLAGLRVISVECDGLHATKNELRAAVVCGAKAARATAKRAREEAAAQRGEGGTRSEPLKSALSWPISSGGEEKGGGSVTVIQHRISGSSSSFMGKIAEAVQMQSSVKEWQEAVLHEGDEGGVALRPAAYHEVASAAELEKIADRGSEGDSARLWNRRFALVGLHTCGNLALSTMDAFLAHESAQLLVLVACCYSKSVSGEGYGQTWEPISSAVRAALHEHTQSGAGGESGGQISLLCEASLMTACHGNLSQRQVGCGGDDMTFFRLLYQLYLSQFVCRDALESVRGLHVSTATSFSDYCVRVAAVSRKKEQKVRGSSEMEASMCEVASSGSERSTPVAVDVLMETATGGLAASHSSQAEPGRTLGSEDELDSFFEAHVHLRVRVLVYWTLRSIFGEAVESLILTDRLLYMEESGVAARLFPVFEPSASPRCICLVAEKLAPGKPLLSGPLSSENCAALKRQHPE